PSLKDKWIYNPITKLKEYRDYESMEYRLPAWVDEPFPDNSDDSKTCKYLFKKIIPTEGLNSKPSGATFLFCWNTGKNFMIPNMMRRF
ncbi:hypothetical protein ACXO9X_09405, partial [Lactobacillus delbrueckii subsp. bulgaricus]